MLRKIDQEKCTGCGACFKSCGLDVFRLNTNQVEMPPCQNGCPAGVDVRAYVHLLQQGRTREAASVLMETNPIPALTGRACHRFCEKKCARSKVDEAGQRQRARAVRGRLGPGSSARNDAGDACGSGCGDRLRRRRLVRRLFSEQTRVSR